MSQPHNDIDDRLEKIEKKLDKIHSFLLGGEEYGKPGMSADVLKMMEDIYKPEEGLKARVEKWIRWQWMAHGAMFLIVGVAGIWKWLSSFKHNP